MDILHVRLSPDALAALDKLRGTRSRSDLVRRAVDLYLKSAPDPDTDRCGVVPGLDLNPFRYLTGMAKQLITSQMANREASNVPAHLDACQAVALLVDRALPHMKPPPGRPAKDCPVRRDIASMEQTLSWLRSARPTQIQVAEPDRFESLLWTSYALLGEQFTVDWPPSHPLKPCLEEVWEQYGVWVDGEFECLTIPMAKALAALPQPNVVTKYVARLERTPGPHTPKDLEYHQTLAWVLLAQLCAVKALVLYRRGDELMPQSWVEPLHAALALLKPSDTPE